MTSKLDRKGRPPDRLRTAKATRSLRGLVFPRQQRLYLLNEWWQRLVCGLQYDSEVNVELPVHETVPNAARLRPGNMGIRFPKFG